MRGKLWIVLLAFSVGCGATAGNKGELTPQERLRRAEGWIEKGKYQKAVAELQDLLAKFPGAEWAPEAQFLLAEGYYRSGDYSSAISEYEQVVEQYGLSPWAERAQFQIGMCHLKQSLPPSLDQEDTYKALEVFGRFLEDYPESPLAERAKRYIRKCRDKLAEKLYQMGLVYRKLGHPEAAEIYLRDLLKEYPDSRWAPWALYELGRLAEDRGDLGEARRAFEGVLSGEGEESLKHRAWEALKKLKAEG